jgi:protein SCO1/2
MSMKSVHKHWVFVLPAALLVAGGAAVAQDHSDPAAAMDHSQHAAAMMDHSQHAMAMDHSEHAGAAMDHSEHAGAAMDHSQHAAAMATPSPYDRSQHAYTLPEVTLRDQAGRPVPMSELANAAEPLAVNFIFSTCTTICPVMTATFAQMRMALGADADRVQMVSITIDPEHDTPAVLAEYAALFDAPQDWRFLTGSPADVESVVRAFDAWTGSKATHRPVTVLRRAGGAQWLRLEGLGSGAALAEHVRTLLE